MTNAKREEGGKIRAMILSCNEIVRNLEGGGGRRELLLFLLQFHEVIRGIPRKDCIKKKDNVNFLWLP